MLGDARLSPKTRGIKDINERVSKLEEFQNRYEDKVIRVDFEQLVGTEMWNQHWKNYRKILELFDDSQELSDDIKRIIKERIKSDI